MDDDLARLQGTWTVVELEMDGRNMPANMLGGARVVVDGTAFTTVAMGSTYDGMLEVDSSATPKSFNLRFTAGPEKGNVALGIYELQGDTWRLCLTTTAKSRPAAFATSPGSGLALETLKRGEPAAVVTNAAPVETATADREASDDLAGEWKMVSGVLDGQALPKSVVGMGRRVVAGNETTVTFGPQLILKAIVTRDPTKRPMWIDYQLTGGANAGKTQLGIYELDGGTLKVCHAAPGDPRPDGFASKGGDGRTYTVWKLLK